MSAPHDDFSLLPRRVLRALDPKLDLGSHLSAKLHFVIRRFYTHACLNSVICIGSVIDHWDQARQKGIKTITHDEAVADPSKVIPGSIFILSTGGGHGHTGIVTHVTGNKLETIEGNTNDDGSSNGIGVFDRTGRTIDSINRGFIIYDA